MNKASRALILFIAQGAFSGRSIVAPGTAGTVVGVLIYLGMKGLSPWPYLALCILLCLIGIWAAGQAEKILGCKDCPSIVIDEIAGYVISLFLVPHGWQYVVAGFLIFRIFDIVKPWPLRRLQDLRGGTGVMIDDIGAGIYTNIVLQAAVFFLSR